jgi:hypothetical protein
LAEQPHRGLPALHTRGRLGLRDSDSVRQVVRNGDHPLQAFAPGLLRAGDRQSAVPFGEYDETCLVKAWNHWQQQAGIITS